MVDNMRRARRGYVLSRRTWTRERRRRPTSKSCGRSSRRRGIVPSRGWSRVASRSARLPTSICLLTAGCATLLCVATGCGASAHTDTTVEPATNRPPRALCSSYKRAKWQDCISKTGFACSGYPRSARPRDCFSSAQLRLLAVAAQARARAAARAAAAAKARARAAARAAAAAKARAAAAASGNAWHQGYTSQDANVYWKRNNGGSCQVFATNGCWHVEVITRNGCPSSVAVQADEYSGGKIINSLLDSQDSGLPPKTPRVFELDADQAGDQANHVSIECH